jgi:hypothetical protein
MRQEAIIQSLQIAGGSVRVAAGGPAGMLRAWLSGRAGLRGWRRGSRYLGRASRIRATAAVEFAMATPLLVITLGGAADFGLAQFYRATLANAVAAGCEYAYLTGTGVTSANIKTVITDSMPAGASTYLTLSVTGPSGYCVMGSPPTMSAATVPGTCTDGSAAGTYVLITATYTNHGIMNGFMALSSTSTTESATVRLN